MHAATPGRNEYGVVVPVGTAGTRGPSEHYGG